MLQQGATLLLVATEMYIGTGHAVPPHPSAVPCRAVPHLAH
jgi:hypothetical protein